MRRIFVPWALVLTVFSTTHVLAQPAAAMSASAQQHAAAEPLTLASAVQLALENNPEISAARREIDAAEGGRTQAVVYQNPTLGLEVEGVGRDSRTTTVVLSQPFELGGKRAARIAVAERTVDLASAQLATRQAGLRASVTAAFFAALVAQERVRLAQTALELASIGSQTAGKRVASGKVSPVEEIRAKVAEANVRLELVQAQGELQTSLQELRALTAHRVHIEVLDGNVLALPMLPAQAALEERMAQAPALRQAQLEVRRLGAVATLENTKRVPDITVSAGVQRAQDQGRSQAVIGISVPLPFFDTNRGGIAEALGRRNKAEDEARSVELRLRADVAAALQRHATACAEVQALQSEILPGAQSAFDAARKGFELGKFDYLETLAAQRTLLQARTQHLRAVADVHRSATDLDRLLGIPVSIP